MKATESGRFMDNMTDSGLDFKLILLEGKAIKIRHLR